MSAQAITAALRGRWCGSYGVACCPAHEDRKPSLSIADGQDGRLLAKCFAGCDFGAIVDSLSGLGLLSSDGGGDRGGANLRLFRGDGSERVNNAQSLRENPNGDRARAIWDTAQPLAGSIAETYLIGRGLDRPFPPSLRFHPYLKHGPSGQHFGALVAAVQGPDDSITAIQRTFLLPDGRGKARVSDPKMTLGGMGGGAVRLAAPAPLMGIAEGIETALSAMQLFRVPVWAAIGSRLDKIALPRIVRRVIVFADCGEAGLQAANRATEAFTRQRRKVEIKLPAEGDWNDALQARGAA